jgi:gamma-glutamylcysteine synthetase
MDGQSVTLEPGGQFELSGAPVDTLHQTCAEVNQHLYQVRSYQSLLSTPLHLVQQFTAVSMTSELCGCHLSA